jgi:hypothetical protein
MLTNNPQVTQKQQLEYIIDCFLLQLTPQIWSKTQKCYHTFSVQSRNHCLVEIDKYADNLGFSATNINDQLLLPLLSYSL